MATDWNKFLVPTPEHPSDPRFNNSGDPNIPDYQERSFFRGILGSFTDAPGGFKEEMKEITLYWVQNMFIKISLL